MEIAFQGDSRLKTRIIYDGQCPFCTRYTTLVRLKNSVGPVELVDVRLQPELLQELQREGFDLDLGMVFEHQGQRYGGAEAVHRIALLSSSVGWFSQLTARMFGSSALTRIAYPLLRAGRGAVLLALGRDRIHPDTVADRSLFAMFAHVWGLFSFLHLMYYIFYDGLSNVIPSVWAIGALGVALALRPQSARLFVALLIATLVGAWMQMPVHSNHTAVRNFTLLALASAAAYNWLRGRSWAAFVRSFAPAGRAILLIMYVFGVFHKINTDFLDPSVSCAVALWQMMPQPLPWLDALWFKWLAIYGTLIIEALIIVGLLSRRGRHWAIVSGIAFHTMLALSGYGYYPSFSALTIALHFLYLSPEGAARVLGAPSWQRLQEALHSPRGLSLAGIWLAFLWLLTLNGNASLVGLALLPWSVWLIALVYTHGRVRNGERMSGPPVISRTWGINLVTVFFFFSSFAPYLGLKNAQSINMFANLVYEGGRSNHLLMTGPPGPFQYLNGLVRPFDSQGDSYLRYVEKNDLLVTYYDLLNRLDRKPEASVSYERDGQIYRAQSARTLQAEIEQKLHPRWFRNWFVFRPVDLRQPKECSISQ